jgi:hypothetical protein
MGWYRFRGVNFWSAYSELIGDFINPFPNFVRRNHIMTLKNSRRRLPS